MNRKHYHVIEGMPGYMPNSNEIATSKRAALSYAHSLYNSFRDSDAGIIPNDDEHAWHQTGPGYYEKRNGYEALYVDGPCFDDCEDEDA